MINQEQLAGMLEEIRETGAEVKERKHYVKVGNFLSIHTLKKGLRCFVTPKAVTNGLALNTVSEKTHSGKFTSYFTVSDETGLAAVTTTVRDTLAAGTTEVADEATSE